MDENEPTTSVEKIYTVFLYFLDRYQCVGSWSKIDRARSVRDALRRQGHKSFMIESPVIE